MFLEYLRDEIERIVKEHQLDRKRFFEVSKQSYQQIQEKIENTFVNKSERWSTDIHWANMGNYNPKLKCVSAEIQDWSAWITKLPAIIPTPNSPVYVLFEMQSKYWLYETFVSELILVLDEIHGLNDFYIVSKKFEWLISLNHHDVITYVGDNLRLNQATV